MELHSEPFVTAVRRLLDGPKPVLATVALKGHGLIAEVKARLDVSLIHVSDRARDGLPQALAGWLRRRVECA